MQLFCFCFWLHWVFIAAHGLSLVAVSGGYSLLWCSGFSLPWLLFLWSTGSRHVGFSSCSMRAQQLWHAALEHTGFSSCGVWASVVAARGLSSCSVCALGRAGFSSCGMGAQQLWLAGSRAQAKQLWCTGLVAPRHVASSWTRDPTHVPCVGRWILNHSATREVLMQF